MLDSYISWHGVPTRGRKTVSKFAKLIFATLLPALYAVTPVYDADSFSEIQDEADVGKVVLGGVIVGVEDASETMVFARQLETIKNRLYEKKYPEFKGRQFVPVSMEAGPDSEYLTYRLWDGVTSAKVLSDFSTDHETVSASATEFTITFFDIGNMFKVTMRELRRAAKAGVGIQEKLFNYARRGVEGGIDDAIAVGLPAKRTYGLINNPNVSLFTLTNGTWASATGQQILDDLNQMVNSTWVTTLEMFKIDTILMSSAAYALISTKLLNNANSSNITVLQAFLAQHEGVQVKSWTRLNTANAAGTNGRIVAYKRDPEVLEFEMGQDFYVEHSQQIGLEFITWCRATVGGVAIHHPLAMLYCDNCNI